MVRETSRTRDHEQREEEPLVQEAFRTEGRTGLRAGVCIRPSEGRLLGENRRVSSERNGIRRNHEPDHPGKREAEKIGAFEGHREEGAALPGTEDAPGEGNVEAAEKQDNHLSGEVAAEIEPDRVRGHHRTEEGEHLPREAGHSRGPQSADQPGLLADAQRRFLRDLDAERVLTCG
ncbi:UNVERIFIED_CONTAM: hypothetical protein PYX00_002955 [Menopon gallinae]|uniref:Uncharacterized protein n=1 Tax=Menopon gallinae TaxID=328185 RepID=A0AAW2HYH6_9NEOP